MRAFSLLALLAFLPAAASAQSPTVLSDLAKATEELRAVANSASPELARIENAARVGCNAIRRLVEDPAFMSALEATLKSDPKAAALLRNDLLRFATEFSEWEVNRLVQSGVSKDTALQLAATIAAVRQQPTDAKLTAATVHLTIRKFGQLLCDTSKAIQDKQMKEIDVTKRRTWWVRMAGVTVITVDVIAAGGTAGYSLLSTLLGQGLLTWEFPGTQ